MDGWNHFIAAQSCYGYEVAAKFPVDRLARHLATQVREAAVTDVVVVMALPDRNQPGEEPGYWAWRKRLNKLHNYGVRYEKARFRYQDLVCSACGAILDRKVKCPACDSQNPVTGRRKEKGADIKLASFALNGAWRKDYSTLILLSQDSDFGPLIQQVKEVHKQQNRTYTLYSAFPTCDDPAHEHWPVPGTQSLPLSADIYRKLAAQPYADPRTVPTGSVPQKPAASSVSPGTRP